MTTTTEITFSPREKAPQGTRVTSWWIDGSRDRYGLAYFISNRTVFRRDGAVEEQIILMENHRPYGVNREVGVIDERPKTWEQLDNFINAEA